MSDKLLEGDGIIGHIKKYHSIPMTLSQIIAKDSYYDMEIPKGHHKIFLVIQDGNVTREEVTNVLTDSVVVSTRGKEEKIKK